MVFIFQFVNVMYYIDQFVDIEESLALTYKLYISTVKCMQ